MLNRVSTEFSIRDLENLSGVKAHTIRIWEKRYSLLSPKRTASNIRLYDIEALRKLLNTSWLLQNGHKISKIASMSDEEMLLKVREASVRETSLPHLHNELKVAMLSFDEQAYNQVVDQLEQEMTFRQIFINVFIPFLEDVGLWWMTDVIKPAHEHFVSNLIRQKLFANIEKASRLDPSNNNELYVLFTPMNEIHDLGLLFVHYELLLRGKHSIYLGQSVPINDLTLVDKNGKACTYVCASSVLPDLEHLPYLVMELHGKLIDSERDQLVMFGHRISSAEQLPELPQVKYFPDLNKYLEDF